MNVRLVFVVLWALAALFLAACTDAGKCERGTEGCACTQARIPGCNTNNLSCVDGVCVDDGGGGDGDGDGDGDTGMTRDAGSPPDVECGEDSLEAACVAFCDALCANQERFCWSSQCTASDCTLNGRVVRECTMRCGALSDEGSRVACAKSLCEDQISPALNCDDFGVELGGAQRSYETLCFNFDPMCVQKHEIGCSDTCGTNRKVGGDLTMNGACEDGHDPDSISSDCERGTDCTDCGPHPCAKPSEPCLNHRDCCGFYGAGALCVDPDGPGGDADPFCLPRCDRDNPCPTGFRCNPTSAPGMSVCVENM